MKSRISFDAAKKRLVYRGFMCKSDYDRLSRLHDDLAYRRALELLFQISTEADHPLHRRLRFVLAVLVILCLILATAVWWHLLHDPIPAATHTGYSILQESDPEFLFNP